MVVLGLSSDKRASDDEVHSRYFKKVSREEKVGYRRLSSKYPLAACSILTEETIAQNDLEILFRQFS